MQSLEILIPIIVIAVILVALIFWRSKREEKRARESGGKLRSVKTADALAGTEPRVEPDLIAQATERARQAADGELSSTIKADPTLERLLDENEIPTPTEEPPIYAELEREEAEEAKAEEAKTEKTEVPADPRSRAVPPVDSAIEWILDITPVDGMQFALGGVKSLKLELARLNLPLLVRVFAQSSKDGLYYEAEELHFPARHVVASMVLANRAAKLDEVGASRFYQVLEQSAAQNNVVIRRELEPGQAVLRSATLKNFINYFDRKIEVVIAPVDPEHPFDLEAVSKAAQKAGFESSSGCWELRFDPSERDPVISLAFGPEGTDTLVLTYDLPLGNLARGDLKRYFALANHLAAELKSRWSDCSKHPVDAGGAMLIAEQAEAHGRLMTENGVEPGSNRARLLFSR